MTKNKEKNFDCIKMKNNIQAQVHIETMNMTKAELLHYFNENTKTTGQAPGLSGAFDDSGIHKK
ncbi:MAG: hypothetical protein FWF73_04650 [Spirochaetes bacterium]|nr:hypothetical protein [Spirochaetota bacterium]